MMMYAQVRTALYDYFVVQRLNGGWMILPILLKFVVYFSALYGSIIITSGLALEVL
jgi:hypothetical protein